MNRHATRATALALMASAALAPPAGAAAAPHARATLSLPGAFTVARQSVSVTGRSVGIRGVVRPYVAGQKVTLTARIGSRTLLNRRLAVRRSPGGTYGYWTASVVSPSAGTVTTVAVHGANRTLGAFRATTRYTALSDAVSYGSRGTFVSLLQQRLAAIGLWVPQSGVYDSGTALAVDAYHRLLHWGHSQALDHQTVIWALNGWGAFPIRYPKDGHHAEGNLSLQLLALIDKGKVQRIYPISSGKPSTPTVLGRYRVYQKTPGYLPDGMYFSNFFVGGYAIHGYNPAPDYPASHGCMRVPISDAISIYGWINMGDRVDVYY